jgi:hypothetical protein
MARTDRKGRTRSQYGRFVALPHYLLNSNAWRSLSPVERCAYLEILGRYNGRNNGRLAMSGRVLARELRIARATATRALGALRERGFLEVVRSSSFACKIKRAAEYRATYFRCDVTGSPPSKAFMRWTSSQKHFTASPESHNGFTRGPPGAVVKQNCRNVALS